MEESDREGGFKVRDRRRFSREGEAKTESETAAEPITREEPDSVKEPEEKPEKTEAPKEAREETSSETKLPPIDFTGLIVSLANTALFQLGLVSGPESGIHKDLEAARQTIDIMALLEKKTQGNLTDQERTILTETLFQLRMAFVEAAK
jgi:hypothetical protein